MLKLQNITKTNHWVKIPKLRHLVVWFGKVPYEVVFRLLPTKVNVGTRVFQHLRERNAQGRVDKARKGDSAVLGIYRPGFSVKALFRRSDRRYRLQAEVPIVVHVVGVPTH